jgi:hypothetical protein
MSLVYDLEYLKHLGFKDPSKFKYNGKTWSAWYHANFKKYLIKNKTDGTKSTTIATWIKTVYYGHPPKAILSQNSTPSTDSLSYNDYKSCLINDPLSDEFLNLLNVKIFEEVYKSHPNISTFDFSLCNDRFHLNKMYGKRHILLFDTGEFFYGKYKFNSDGSRC